MKLRRIIKKQSDPIRINNQRKISGNYWSETWLREDISMNIPGMIIDNITDILESKAILLWKESSIIIFQLFHMMRD